MEELPPPEADDFAPQLDVAPSEAPPLPNFTNTTRDIDFNAPHTLVAHARAEDPFSQTLIALNPTEFAPDDATFLATAPRQDDHQRPAPEPLPLPVLDPGVFPPGHKPTVPGFWAPLLATPEASGAVTTELSFAEETHPQPRAASDNENRTPSPGGLHYRGSAPGADPERISSGLRSGPPRPSAAGSQSKSPARTRAASVQPRELPDQFLGMSKMFPVGFFAKVREQRTRQNMRNLKTQMDHMKGALTETWEQQRVDNSLVMGRPMEEALAEADVAQGTFLTPALQRGPFDLQNPVPLTIQKQVGAPIGSLGTSVFRGVQAAAEVQNDIRIDFEAPGNLRHTLKPTTTQGSRFLPADQQPDELAARSNSQTARRLATGKEPLPPVVLQKRPSTAGGNFNPMHHANSLPEFSQGHPGGNRIPPAYAAFEDTTVSASSIQPTLLSTQQQPQPTQRGGGTTARSAREVDFSHVDALKWVKKLVTYTETHPIYIPETRDAGATVEVTKDLQFRTTVFPNLKPGRREDTFLLQHWLTDLLSSLSATVKDRVVPPGANLDELTRGTPEAAADAALWIYTVAFEELKRQVHIQCREKAEMLHMLWSHFFTLVELRCCTRYEREIKEAAEQRDAILSRLDTAHDALLDKERDKIEIEKDKEDELRTERMTSKALAQRYAHTQAELEGMAAKIVAAEKMARDEVERRLAVDAENLTWRKKNETLKQQVATANKVIEEQLASMERMASNRSELEKHLEYMTGQLEEKCHLIEETGITLETERERLQHSQQLAAKYKSLSETRDTELTESRALCASLQTQVESLTKQLEQSEKKASAESDAVIRLQETLRTKTDESSQINLMYARLRKDHQTLNEVHQTAKLDTGSQMATLEGELEETKRLLTRCRRDLERTTEELRVSVLENDTLTRRNKEQEAEFKHIKPLIKRLQFSVETMCSSMTEVRDLALLREEAWEGYGIQGRRHITLNACSVAIDSMIEELRQYRVENSNLRDKLESIEKIRKRVDNQVLEAKTAMEKALAEKVSMQKDRDKAQTERERLKHLSTDYEAQTNDLRLKVEDYEGIVRQKDSDLAKLKRRLENLNQTETDLKRALDEVDQTRKQLYDIQAHVITLEDEISEQKQTNMDFLKSKIELEQKQTEFEKNFNKNLQEMTVLRTAINVRDSRIKQAVEYLSQQGGRIRELKEKNVRLSRAVGLLEERLAHAETARSVAAFIWPDLTRVGLRLDHVITQMAEKYGNQTMVEHRADIHREMREQIMRLLEETDLLPENFVPLDDDTFWTDVLKPIDPPPPPSATLFTMLRAMDPARRPTADGEEEAKKEKKKKKKDKEKKEKGEAEAPAPGTDSPPHTVFDSEEMAQAAATTFVESLPKEFAPTPFALRADSYIATLADSKPLTILEHVESEMAANASIEALESRTPPRPWYDEVKWLKVQRGLLTKMLKSLRKHFASEVKTRQNLELQLLNQEARSISQQMQTQMDFEKSMEDFVFELRPMFALVSGLRKSAVDLKDVTQLTRTMLVEDQNVRKVAESTITQLQAIEETHKQMVHKETQVEDPDKDKWKVVLDEQADMDPTMSLDGQASSSQLADGGSRKYHIRFMGEDALMTFAYETLRVGMEKWKARAGKFTNGETVFDHIEYQASIKGVDKAASSAAASIGQAVRSCKRLVKDSEANLPARVRIFARLLSATGPDGAYDANNYWFLLSCCTMVRNLLGLNWKLFEKDWSKGPTPLPLACADDAIANLFNTTMPSALAFYDRSVMPLVHESPQGMVIDFDSFLEMLCEENRLTRCPINPFAFPRKIIHGATQALLSHTESFDPVSGMMKEGPLATVRMMGGGGESSHHGSVAPTSARRSSLMGVDPTNPFGFQPRGKRASVLTNDPPPSSVPAVATFSRMPGASNATIGAKNFNNRRMSTTQGPQASLNGEGTPQPSLPGTPKTAQNWEGASPTGSTNFSRAPSNMSERRPAAQVGNMKIKGLPGAPSQAGASRSGSRGVDAAALATNVSFGGAISGKEFQPGRGSVPIDFDVDVGLPMQQGSEALSHNN